MARFSLIAITTNLLGIISLVSSLLHLSRGLATPDRIALKSLTTIMTKITNSTRVKAPNIQALDFRSHTTVNSRIIDATSLNPSGRDTAERTRNKEKLKLLNFKKDCTISVMNIWPIRKKAKKMNS